MNKLEKTNQWLARYEASIRIEGSVFILTTKDGKEHIYPLNTEGLLIACSNVRFANDDHYRTDLPKLWHYED